MITIGPEHWISFFAAMFGGGGVGYVFAKLYIRSEAKAALREDITEIKEELKSISKNYVQCTYCEVQHNGLQTILGSIDNKLNILLEKS